MPETRSVYICQQCNYHSPAYLGKCPQCDSWNSFVETFEESLESRVKSQGKSRVIKLPGIINLKDVEKKNYQRISTGLGEFDRVLGGGIVMGSVVLVAGDPGIGKSTLLTQLALDIQGKGESVKGKDTSPFPFHALRCLYVAGEESAQQIKIRVDRVKEGAELAILNEVDVDVICGVIRESRGIRERWGLVIIDSIQTLQTEDLTGVAGSVGQVRECAHRLQRLAKELHVPIFIVGHVTKEGTVAGPKTLEHLVDVVLSLEGEQTSNFRILRANKNRFGPTDEVGIFEMEEEGMVEVKNPSKLFLGQKVEAPGSAVVVTMAGYRPLLVEIQALVAKSFLPMPRRVGTGVDNNRLQLLTAVLQSRMKLPLYDKDIFVNMTGGLKITEPAADLGIVMAIISALKEQTIKPKTVFVGEVGLLGELRSVRQMDKRANEAKKLGFTKVISPETVRSLSEAVKQSLL